MTLNNRRGTSKVTKNLKDYIVPIVIVLIIVVLILNYIFSDSSSSSAKPQDPTAITVDLDNVDTEAYIIYTWWNKTKLDSQTKMYKWEKVQVAKWQLNISFSNSWSMVLNRLWELRYNEDGTYTLYSSDLWVNSKWDSNIEMRYAKIKTPQQAVFSLSQNEVASTIYVVSWSVDIETLVWNTTTLQKWEKISIMKTNSNDKNFDMSLAKEKIDDYTKNDDWFIKNNWASYLTQENSSMTWITSTWSFSSWTTNSWTSIEQPTWLPVSNTNMYVSFSNIYDEIQVSSSNVDVVWNILADWVYKIELNSYQATINQETKTFIVKNVSFPNLTNDLVYRVYDEYGKMLYKWVITVYNPTWSNQTWASSTTQNTTTWEANNWYAKVENYPITSSTSYKIVSPTQNPYTTQDELVKIEWTVPAKTVEKIVINGFKLQKFSSYSSYWQYFANSSFGNLKDWVNIYKIQYYWADQKMLYENNFTIIKQPKETQETTTSTWETQSWTTN